MTNQQARDEGKPVNHARAWTARELTALVQYQHHTLDHMATLIPTRSRTAIAKKASELGIPRFPRKGQGGKREAAPKNAAPPVKKQQAHQCELQFRTVVRRIVQISAYGTDDWDTVAVMCDDGTVWSFTATGGHVNGVLSGGWSRVPDVPQGKVGA